MNSPTSDLAKLERRPLFITGVGKAGKSPLLDLFRHFDEFLVVDEPLSTWRIGAHLREDDCRGADEATEAEVLRIREEIASAVRSHGKSRYVDVLSHHALQLPFLKKVFPEALVVVVTRHPKEFMPEAVYFWTLKPSVQKVIRNRWRSVKLASLPGLARRFLVNMMTSRKQGRLSTWGAVVPGQKEFARTHSVAELAAYQWATLNQVALEESEHWGDSMCFVKFEDLKHRPRETIEPLLQFCESPATPERLDIAAGHFDPDFSFDKRVELSEEDWETVWPVVREVAEKLDYEVPT